MLGRPIKSGDDSNGLAAACLRSCAVGEMKIMSQYDLAWSAKAATLTVG
jgi:hypothetical protein